MELALGAPDMSYSRRVTASCCAREQTIADVFSGMPCPLEKILKNSKPRPYSLGKTHRLGHGEVRAEPQG